MSQLNKHSYSGTEKNVVEFTRMDGFDGRKDSLYVGVAPVVYDGEIKAVITLEYSYASFLDRRSVRYNEYQYFKKKDGIAGQNEPS